MSRAPYKPDFEDPALRRRLGALVLASLGASLLCVAVAPVLMPRSYSIIEHSISESAAQRVEGVWLARAGLLLFGLGVLSLAGASRWTLWSRMAHRGFGVAIISTAAFAHMPWEDVPYDEFEDLLHSIGSFAVGLSFVVGVVAVSVERGRAGWRPRVFDGVAIAASTVIPMIMFSVDGYAGLAQRLMFLIAYGWYGAEAWRCVRSNPEGIVWEDVGLPDSDADVIEVR